MKTSYNQVEREHSSVVHHKTRTIRKRPMLNFDLNELNKLNVLESFLDNHQ